jgi:hypothetical protein
LDKHTSFGVPNKKGSGVVARIAKNLGKSMTTVLR